MIGRAVADAARRLADQQTAALADVPTLRGFFATVVSVSGSSIVVKWRGINVTGRHLPSYTPAPGDWAFCLLVENQVLAVDRSA